MILCLGLFGRPNKELCKIFVYLFLKPYTNSYSAHVRFCIDTKKKIVTGADTCSSAAFRRRRFRHLCILEDVWANCNASSDLFVDCIILLHAPTWQKLCKLYVLVVPVKPVCCWTYKGNNYALATFGQILPGLPGTTLMRCPDKIDSLKNKGSFLHFLPVSLQHIVGNPILYLCPCWNCVSSHSSRGGCGKRRIQEETNTRRKILYKQLILTGNVLLLPAELCNYFQDIFTLFQFCIYFLLLRIQFCLS